MGIGEFAVVATKRVIDASNYVRIQGFVVSYTLGNTLPRYIALELVLCGYSSRCSSSVSPNVFTLDHPALREKCRILRQRVPNIG